MWNGTALWRKTKQDKEDMGEVDLQSYIGGSRETALKDKELRLCKLSGEGASQARETQSALAPKQELSFM